MTPEKESASAFGRGTKVPIAPEVATAKGNAQPAKMRIELQIRVVHDSTKSNVGFCYLAVNKNARAIVCVLKRANAITERALRSSDANFIAFVFGVLVAELLLFRRRRDGP